MNSDTKLIGARPENPNRGPTVVQWSVGLPQTPLGLTATSAESAASAPSAVQASLRP